MSDATELTRNQSLVHETLCRAEGPLSAYAILDRLRDEGFRAPLQVYRALDKLTGMGLVHRLESLNAFVACADAHAHDDHGLIAFAICERCGLVEEFADPVVRTRLEGWAKENQFHADKTTIEIRGRCAACGVAEGAPESAKGRA